MSEQRWSNRQIRERSKAKTKHYQQQGAEIMAAEAIAFSVVCEEMRDDYETVLVAKDAEIAALEHYKNSVDRLKQERREMFGDMYDLLSAIMRQKEEMHGDGSIWFDTETTAHEELCNIAAKYEPAIGVMLAARLEVDCS